MANSSITIADVVLQLGINAVAHECSVSVQTVYNWVKYETVPTVESRAKLVKLSMGLLSHESIQNQYAEAQDLKAADDFRKL